MRTHGHREGSTTHWGLLGGIGEGQLGGLGKDSMGRNAKCGRRGSERATFADGGTGNGRARWGRGSGRATFAGAVWPPEHSALVYGPEGFEHLADVLICLLLP